MKSNLLEDKEVKDVMKKAVEPLKMDMARNTPSSENGSKTRSQKAAALNSSLKYGSLVDAIGVGTATDKQLVGQHRIHVGYFLRNSKKAFVSGWLNNGWVHWRTGKKIQGKRWMQMSENNTEADVQSLWSKEMESLLENKLKPDLE